MNINNQLRAADHVLQILHRLLWLLLPAATVQKRVVDLKGRRSVDDTEILQDLRYPNPRQAVSAYNV